MAVQGKLKNKGITSLTENDIEGWLNRLQLIIADIESFNPSLASFSVAANSVEDETFTVSGLTTDMGIVVTSPVAGLTAGLLVNQAWVSTADTLKIRFNNTTGSGITESAASWIIIGIKQ